MGENLMQAVELNEEEIHWRVMRVRSQLVSEEIGYSGILLNLKLVPSWNVKTLAVDGKCIYYNPRFVSTMSDKDLKTALLHEGGHVIFKHHLRRGNRNAKLWNVAGDFIINWWLHANGKRIPRGWLLDAAYIGMVTEQVYAILDKQGDQGEPCDDGEPGDEPEGDTPDDGGEDDGDGDDTAKGEDGEDDGDGESTGPGEQVEDDAPENNKGGSEPGEPSGQPDDFDQVGEVWDYPGEDGEPATAEDIERAENEVADALANSAMIEKMAGSGGSNEFGEAIEANAQAQLAWRDLLRDYLVATMSSEETWQRPNRQHIGRGLYLPGQERENGGEIHIAIDSSASVSDTEFKAFIAEVESICEDTGVDTIKYAYFTHVMIPHGLKGEDDEWWQTCDIGNGELPEFKRVSGGTDFDPIFGSIEYLGHEPQCVVVFTDGYAGTTTKDPMYPVIWATTGRKADFANGEFGDTVFVDINQR
jgi:predicted metal-dependent peptidase